MRVYILFGMLCITLALPTPDKGTDQSQDNQDEFKENSAMDYLKQFGFMGVDNPMLGSLTDEDAYPQAISEFQAFAGLQVTGKLNAETIKMMKTPRCGVKDIMAMNDVARKKRYTLEGSKWYHKDISYMVSQYTTDLPRSDADKEVDRAFRVWQSVTDLTFRKVTSRPNVDIRFAPKNHGDDFPFDNVGGTLAHAFFPQYGGAIHMDDAEMWTANTSRGINFFQVFTHELGHALGLQHSSVSSALMAPFYKGYQPNFQLDPDDISGIQSIYGKKTDMFETDRPVFGPATTTTTRRPFVGKPTPPSGIPNPCSDGRIDAIIMTEDNTVHVFRRNYYLVLDDYGIRNGYPKLISSEWQGLPDDIDAAVSFNAFYGYVYNWNLGRYARRLVLDERIYFFKGDLVYLYQGGRSLRYGYPKKISEEFPGLPNNIDSAFVWSGNGRTYFTKGSDYYRYRHGSVGLQDGKYYEKPGAVDSYYPRKLSRWGGLPDSVDTVFVWRNRRTYFFKDDVYYRFHDGEFKVDTARQYPRSIKPNWFGCIGALEKLTTGTVEADIMNDEQFLVVTQSDEGISGQSPLTSSVAFITFLLVVNSVHSFVDIH